MVASQLGLAPGGCSRHLEGIPARMKAIVPQHVTPAAPGAQPELLRGDCCFAFMCSLPNIQTCRPKAYSGSEEIIENMLSRQVLQKDGCPNRHL